MDDTVGRGGDVPDDLGTALATAEAEWYEASRVYVNACQAVLDDRMAALAAMMPGHTFELVADSGAVPFLTVDPAVAGREALPAPRPLAEIDDEVPNAGEIDRVVEIVVGVAYKMTLTGHAPRSTAGVSPPSAGPAP